MICQYSVGVKAPRGVVTILIFGNSGSLSSTPIDTACCKTLRTATRYWLTVVVLKVWLRKCVNSSSAAKLTALGGDSPQRGKMCASSRLRKTW